MLSGALKKIEWAPRNRLASSVIVQKRINHNILLKNVRKADRESESLVLKLM